MIFTDATKFDALIELTSSETGNTISVRVSHITTVCQAEDDESICSILSLINSRRLVVRESKMEIFEMIENCMRKAEQRGNLRND